MADNEIYVQLEDGTPEINVEIGGNAMINMQYDGRIDEILATKVSMGALLDMVYPVGSIYLSTVDASPGMFLGGTWEQIKDTFLLSAGDTYTAGDAGGEAEHLLTSNESGQKMVAIMGGGHTHTVTVKGGSVYSSGSSRSGPYASGTSTSTTTATIDSDTGSHSHSIAGMSASQAHNNMPPYLVVYMWKRTA